MRAPRRAPPQVYTTGISIYAIYSGQRLVGMLRKGDQSASSGGAASSAASTPEKKGDSSAVLRLNGFMFKTILANIVLTVTLILYIVVGGTKSAILWLIFAPIHRLCEVVIAVLILYMLRPKTTQGIAAVSTAGSMIRRASSFLMGRSSSASRVMPSGVSSAGASSAVVGGGRSAGSASSMAASVADSNMASVAPVDDEEEPAPASRAVHSGQPR